MKHLITVASTAATIISIANIFSISAFASNLESIEDYKNALSEHFSLYQQSEITYLAIRQIHKTVPDSILQDEQRDMDLSVELLKRVRNGEFTQEEIERRRISEDQLLAFIAQSKRKMANEPDELTLVYAKDGRKMKNIMIISHQPHLRHINLYDGHSAIHFTPEQNRIRTWKNNIRNWMAYREGPTFGACASVFLGDRVKIESIDAEKRTIMLSQPKPFSNMIRLTLLEDDDRYWTMCEELVEGEDDYVVHRIRCSEFKSFYGLKVPQLVVFERPDADGFYAYQTLTLMDVKLNDQCDFAEDAFTVPPMDGARIIQPDQERM